jgi:hypothetical protein
MNVKCKDKCGGDLELSFAVKLPINGGDPSIAAFFCCKCGRLHSYDGKPLSDKRGNRAFKKGNDCVLLAPQSDDIIAVISIV